MTKPASGPRNHLSLFQRVSVVIAPWVLRALGKTWRVRTVNDGGWRELRAGGSAIVFSLWHGELLPLTIQHRDEGICVLISEHRDGEMIARTVERLGFTTIRGSTSRGAARALLALRTALQDGREIAITPDGPRGPAHKYASGALIAAHGSGAPIIAIGVSASRAWRLKSWDAFMIPKPFAAVTIAYSDPICVNGATAREAIDQAARFELLMDETGETANRFAVSPAGTNGASATR